MGRPVFDYELKDPDFAWLISNYQHRHPKSIFIGEGALPVVVIREEEEERTEERLSD